VNRNNQRDKNKKIKLCRESSILYCACFVRTFVLSCPPVNYFSKAREELLAGDMDVIYGVSMINISTKHENLLDLDVCEDSSC
jgi:hypothetical protein